MKRKNDRSIISLDFIGFPSQTNALQILPRLFPGPAVKTVCAVERALFMPLICVSSVMPSCSRMLLNRASMALHHLRLDHEVAQGFEVFSGRRIFLLWRVHRGG